MLYCVSTWIWPPVVNAANSSLGRPTLPLRELYVPAVLDMLLGGVRDLQARGLVNSSMSEDMISTLISQRMHAARMANNSSDIINWVMQPSIPIDPKRSLELVEPDFLFTWGLYPSREDPSLIVEAKRLQGTGPSLAGNYVGQGVVRFVDGRYGRGHDYGIMLGYVVVASVSSAISRVSAAMHRHKGQTQQSSAFAPDNSLCTYPNTHHSSHSQRVTNQPITLVHIFVDFS